MGTGAESLAGINLNNAGIIVGWEMAPVVNCDAIAYYDRLEALLFPLLVPVFVFSLAHLEGDARVG